MAVDPHRFQEVTHESWFSRIGGAIKGVFVGLVIFALSFPLLFWNEGRAVRRYKTLVEGAGAVVGIAADSVDATNQGALVHLSADAIPAGELNDPTFGVTVDALKLRRTVEMYQWKENRDSDERTKVGGGTETVTTYEYTLEWDDSIIDSSQFRQPAGHQNPASMPYESRELVADGVSFGAFTLADSQLGKMSNWEDVSFGAEFSIEGLVDLGARRIGSGVFIGDPANPEPGDVRITFSVVEPGAYSVVAAQINETFEPYRTTVGGTIELVASGAHSAEAMFETAQAENTMLTWGLRLFGFLLMFMGLGMMLRPLSVLADVIPVLGRIVGAGTSLIAGLVAAVLSLLTISTAWLFYRPLLGLALLVVAAVLMYLIRTKLRGSATARTQAT